MAGLGDIFGSDIQGAIDKLIESFTNAAAAAKQTADSAKDIKLDPQAAKGIIEYETAANNAAAAIKGVDSSSNAYIGTLGKLKQSTTEHGEALQREAEKLVIAQMEVKRLEAEIRALNKSIQDGHGDYDKNIHNLSVYTQRLQENKIAVSNSTSALRQYINPAEQATEANRQLGISIGKVNINLESIATQVGRSILRFIGMGLVLGVVFKAFDLLSNAIMQAIPGTDAYIEKQEKLIQATQSLSDAIGSTTKAMEEALELEQKLIDAETKRTRGIDLTVKSYKDKENAIKATGVVNGEIWKQEQELFEAQQQTRVRENNELEKKKKYYTDISGVLKDMADKSRFAIGGLWTDVKNTFKSTPDQTPAADEAKKILDNSILTTDIKNKIKLAIDKAAKEGGDISKAIDQQYQQYAGKAVEYEQQIDEKRQEIENAQIERQSKLNNIIYSKKLELIKATANTEEEYRQLRQKNDIETIDKIVSDSKAKITKAQHDLELQMITAAKSFGEVGNGTFSEQIGKARLILGSQKDTNGNSLLSFYQRQINAIKKAGNQDENNRIYDLNKRHFFAQEQAEAAETQAEANSATFNASHGAPDYNKMAAALDAQTKAKKEALKNEFQVTSEQYRQNGMSTEEIEKQFSKSLEDIDKQSYSQRLKLAQDYFTRVTEIIERGTSTALSKSNLMHLQNLNKIMAGGGSTVTKEYRERREELTQAMDAASVKREGVQKEIPAAEQAYNTAQAQYDSAKGDDAKAEAKKELDIAEAKYNELREKDAQYNYDYLNAKQALAKQEEELAKTIGNKLVNTMQGTIDAINKLQDARYANEEWLVQQQEKSVNIQAEQQIAAIDATTNYAVIKSNQKSQVEAQLADKEADLQQKSNAIALKRAKADKQAAEMKIVVSTAAAVTKDLEQYPYPANLAIIALDVALGAAQLSAASAAPLPQYRMGTGLHGTTSQYFVAGEGNKQELIIPADNKAPYLTGASEKGFIYNEPLGTHVIPLNKLEQMTYANSWNNAIMPNGNSNNELMHQIQKTFKMLNETTAEGNYDIVRAIIMSAPKSQNTGRELSAAIDKLQYLQFKVTE